MSRPKSGPTNQVGIFRAPCGRQFSGMSFVGRGFSRDIFRREKRASAPDVLSQSQNCEPVRTFPVDSHSPRYSPRRCNIA